MPEASTMKDLYETLGVKKDASQDDIRKAYLKLAKKYHPDKTGGDKAAEDRLKEVNAAYDTLKNPEKRAEYDRMRESPFGAGGFQGGFGGGQSPFGQGGFSGGFGGRSPFGDNVEVDIGDLFGDLFGGGATRGARPGAQGFRSARRGPRPGPDVEAEISVTLRDVAEGAKKNLRIAPPGDEPRTVSVAIPAGVEDGMRLRLAGQGGKGEQHAANGDLYVVVRVASDPNLTRHGRDLECEVPVPFATAALGGKVRVPTLKGQADLTVPAGTQGGQVLRLRGMGLPRFKETARGDQLVRVRITVPTTLTEEQRQAIEKLR